jgi:hypothetical protein
MRRKIRKDIPRMTGIALTNLRTSLLIGLGI